MHSRERKGAEDVYDFKSLYVSDAILVSIFTEAYR